MASHEKTKRSGLSGPTDVNLSVADVYTIGIGPSSSHTVGPMRAGFRFRADLESEGLLDRVATVTVKLFGSLALTGRGHGSDGAVILGLTGERPRWVDPDQGRIVVDAVRRSGTLLLNGTHPIPFREGEHLLFLGGERLPEHPNAMRLTARDEAGTPLHTCEFFSVGGGFVVTRYENDRFQTPAADVTLKHPFSSGSELLAIGSSHDLRIPQIMLENESAWRGEEETRAFLRSVHEAMASCIRRGCKREGELPGGLGVRRRARAIYRDLRKKPEAAMKDPLTVLDWVNLYALAVCEENAAGGRMVTAPTNGAAGVLPAVLTYYERFCPGAGEDGVFDFLLTAAAIGTLYKKRASISGAEVGCQGEVGVACSMAAGALTAVLGGTNQQIENAAEIGMEHNLGLTCDPVGGLVQVPCIERNTMGAVKAINAARLALRGDGKQIVTLDAVIATMRRTGLDMRRKYKETSKGGLAVTVVEC